MITPFEHQSRQFFVIQDRGRVILADSTGVPLEDAIVVGQFAANGAFCGAWRPDNYTPLSHREAAARWLAWIATVEQVALEQGVTRRRIETARTGVAVYRRILEGKGTPRAIRRAYGQ